MTDHFTLLNSMFQRQQQRQTSHLQAGIQLQPLLDKLAARQKNVFFVQIGANDGLLADPLYQHIRAHHWKGLLVEPLPDIFARLKQNYKGTKGILFENAAIAEDGGTRSMLRVDPAVLPQAPDWAAGCATLLDHHNGIHQFCPELEEHLIRESVRTMTMPQLLEKHRVRTIDLLQIDTEGYDYNVLKQLDLDAYQPSIINMEFVHLTEEEKRKTCALLARHDYIFRTEHLDLIAAKKSFLIM